MQFDPLSRRVIGFAIEVHKTLGPGLLEKTYEQWLAFELLQAGIQCQTQKELPVIYKGNQIECCYRIDLLINNKLILELKTVENLLPIHDAQLLTYMKLSQIKTGLLINFNVDLLKNGIKRMVL